MARSVSAPSRSGRDCSALPESSAGATRSGFERNHEPLTRLFDNSGKGRAAHRLSDADVAFFHEHGYVRGGPVLDEKQIAALRTGLEDIREGRNPRTADLYEIDDDYLREPERSVFHFLGAWLIDEAFHDLIFHRAITVKAAQLLDVDRARFWHDQVFYKPARHPGVVTWHQDYSYWTRSVPASHVTCWIALDDATIENGCVHYVPGSHKWGLLPRISLTKDMDAVRRFSIPRRRLRFNRDPWS